ncbi:MAG: DUF89 family protein [Candidatus Helarchaeota archaeon]|nr:DUF89 family protein [Candidatus Helarchaeota archaeon]
MKVQPLCGVCLFQRALKEIQLATDDPLLQFETLKAVINLFANEFDENAISAVLGTKRDRLIRQLTRCPDPYKELKKKSNEIALGLAPAIENVLKGETDPYKRFRLAMLTAIVGNVLEFDILEHSLDLEKPEYLQELLKNAEQDLAIDNIQEMYQLVQSVKQALYLTDNAGEIVFDRFLISELLKLGVQVTVAVKQNPVLNDATLEDAEVSGLIALIQENSRLQIITTGTDHVGLILEELTEPFQSAFESAKFIIAKGMGYYETLADRALQKPVAYLFRTKCSTVARDVGVQLGQNLALLRLNHNPRPNKV